MPNSNIQSISTKAYFQTALKLAATVVLSALILFASQLAAVAQRAEPAPEVPVAELMKDTGLKDLSLGPADAKVTIVEYASLTCGHCGKFHKNIFPQIKKEYVDTGKVRFIFRDFPLDNLAAAGSMLARCAGDDKAYPLLSNLFNRQKDWAFGEGNPVPKLFDLAKQVGFTKESFDKCLSDQALLEKVKAQRARGADVFGVNATPTFFVNGKRLSGGVSFEKFQKAIDPLLADTKE